MPRPIYEVKESKNGFALIAVRETKQEMVTESKDKEDLVRWKVFLEKNWNEQMLSIFEIMEKALLSSGYIRFCNKDDAAVVNQDLNNRCEKCKSNTLYYRGFKNKATGSYRAFTICLTCGDHGEF